MIEIFAKPSLRDLFFQIARRRGNDANVDIDLAGTARPLERLIDQHPQDLVLGFARHVADFIDKQRAAMRLLQRTGLAWLFAIGLFDTEQFDFHSLRRNRRGVDDDERSFGSIRCVMQRARRQFLSGTGRPDDQDAAIGLGGPLNGLAQLIHAGRAAGQNAGRRRELLEFLHFALQARGLQRPRRHQNQPVGLERLFDKVVGAALDRRDRGLDIAVPGDHHDRHLGMVLLDLFQQLQPVELAALQPDVEKHQMRAAIGNFRECRIAVARGPGRKTLVFENPRNQIANIGFVIDNQNVICHRSRLSGQPPVAALILVSLLVASAGRAVSCAASFVSAADSFTSTFAAWPDTANRNRIQAPRAPGRMSAASLSSIRPPWSSRTRLTFGRPMPLSMTSITMSSFSRAAITSIRPFPSSSAGTASIASVAFLMMLVSACEISRRSNCACRTVSATSSPSITGFGIRAKRENSSTIRLISSTCRTIVSVHCSKMALSSVITLPNLRRIRSAES